MTFQKAHRFVMPGGGIEPGTDHGSERSMARPRFGI
jgi:hypothetical protein